MTTSRRPLSARNWPIIQKTARWLSQRQITPNQISVASAVFAAVAGWSTAHMTGTTLSVMWGYAILAVLGILGRALCNIFDGMVAIEGGKSTRSGELFNDIPDRVSDAFIFIGAGYAIAGQFAYGVELGWAAALLAIMTAYVRYVGRAIGAPSNFSGPMAKTHRMAVIVAAILMTPFAAMMDAYALPLIFGLSAICLGCLITCVRRARFAYQFLEGK